MKHFNEKEQQQHFVVLFAIAVVAVAIVLVGGWPLSYSSDSSSSSSSNSTAISVSAKDKFVILTFDDGYKSHYSIAKPILDEFGFKGTFFVVCNYLGDKYGYMSWDDVLELEKQGHDIQSHTMNHKDLSSLSKTDLEYEIAQSKECLSERGIDSNIFANPLSLGWDNQTVISTVANHYDLARNYYSNVMDMHCDDAESLAMNQSDCRFFINNDDNGEGEENDASSIPWKSRYSIRGLSHDYLMQITERNATQAFQTFAEIVNSQDEIRNGTVQEIPILIYHSIDNEGTPSSTPVRLFYEEMKYLSDNGFNVITMDQLAYNETSNSLYVKGLNVKDTLPPTIILPGENSSNNTVDLVVEASGNLTTLPLRAQVYDDADPQPDLVNNASSSSPNLPLGTTTINWTAVDSSGKTSTLFHNITIRDTQVSSLTITSPLNNTTIEMGGDGQENLTITGSASDDASGIKKVEVYVDSFPYNIAMPKEGNDWSVWSFSTTILTEGKHKIVAKAEDRSGNMVWRIINVTVVR